MNTHDYHIRELKKDDLALVLSWRNSDAIRKISNSDRLITEPEHHRWFEGLQKSETSKCFIFENGSQPLGVVNISEIDRVNKRCLWGFYLRPDNETKGLGRIMGFLALEYLFEKAGLEKTCAEVLASNIRGLEFHKKLGFIEEGRLIRHIYRDSQWVDVFMMAHFRSHWEKIKPSIEAMSFSDELRRRRAQ